MSLEMVMPFLMCRVRLSGIALTRRMLIYHRMI